MSQAIAITREDHVNHGGYYADVPGSPRKAELTWTARGPARIAEHTYVPNEARGKGVAMALVEALVADAREQGFRIEPQCSYVAAAFRRHPEWETLLAETPS